MQKKFLIFLLAGILFSFFIWKFFQSPEKHLEKKTKALIKLAEPGGLGSQMQILSQVSKISKHIHFNIQLNAEYEGQTYIARSLNDFRSLMFSYFKYKSGEQLDYKNLRIVVDKKQGTAKFDIFFKRNKKNIFCQAFLVWIKEKKWQVKKIQVSSCAPA